MYARTTPQWPFSRVYRRHLPTCPNKSDHGCACPIWAYGKHGGGRYFRLSLRTKDWDTALAIVAARGRHVDERIVGAALRQVRESVAYPRLTSIENAGKRYTVYVVRGETAVKIGVTGGSAERRLSALRTGSSEPLTIARVFSGSRKLERLLHHVFAEQRTSGEWFRLDGTMRAFIEQSAPFDFTGGPNMRAVIRWLSSFCQHSRTTFPMHLPLRAGAHVACVDCGREFAYDYDRMRRGGQVWPAA